MRHKSVFFFKISKNFWSSSTASSDESLNLKSLELFENISSIRSPNDIFLNKSVPHES